MAYGQKLIHSNTNVIEGVGLWPMFSFRLLAKVYNPSPMKMQEGNG
jgi:hypothetical protein